MKISCLDEILLQIESQYEFLSLMLLKKSNEGFFLAQLTYEI